MPAETVFWVLVGLHVTCALVGFGSVALGGIYGFLATGGGNEEEVRRYFAAPLRLEWLVLVVPFLGAAALAVQPHGRGVLQLWSMLAAGVWLVAAVLLLGVVRPAEARLRTTTAQGARADPGAGRRLGWAGVATDVAFTVAFFLMITQPR
ncbi:MAG: hypothetical protein M0T80_00120 [Actinomycetota bacterium]|nr:hypothetical protein [Actinomycetota bacterium]